MFSNISQVEVYVEFVLDDDIVVRAVGCVDHVVVRPDRSCEGVLSSMDELTSFIAQNDTSLPVTTFP